MIYQKGSGAKKWGSRTKDLTVASLLKLLNAISQMHESHEPKQGKNKENHIQGVDILRGNTLVKPLKYRVKEKTLQVAKGNNISSVEQLKEWWLKFIRNNESQKSTEWHLKCWKKFVTKISISSESRGRTFFFSTQTKAVKLDRIYCQQKHYKKHQRKFFRPMGNYLRSKARSVGRIKKTQNGRYLGK